MGFFVVVLSREAILEIAQLLMKRRWLPVTKISVWLARFFHATLPLFLLTFFLVRGNKLVLYISTSTATVCCSVYGLDYATLFVCTIRVCHYHSQYDFAYSLQRFSCGKWYNILIPFSFRIGHFLNQVRHSLKQAWNFWSRCELLHIEMCFFCIEVETFLKC